MRKINPTCLLKTVVDVKIWRMSRPREISEVRSQAYVQHEYMLFGRKAVYVRAFVDRGFTQRGRCAVKVFLERAGPVPTHKN